MVGSRSFAAACPVYSQLTAPVRSFVGASRWLVLRGWRGVRPPIGLRRACQRFQPDGQTAVSTHPQDAALGRHCSSARTPCSDGWLVGWAETSFAPRAGALSARGGRAGGSCLPDLQDRQVPVQLPNHCLASDGSLTSPSAPATRCPAASGSRVKERRFHLRRSGAGAAGMLEFY